ncbi:MAG: methionine gamma-lyase family protein, partial [Candidatus Melainabacteria bacterium]|nr:methionine gamma-lyase family protein [Candidatus Melainabacteria bacterium]
MSLQLASQNILDQAEEALVLQYKNIDKIALLNQAKVLEAFRTHRLSEEFFAEKTGYGRADAGRETIDKIFASVFKAETAAVRLQIVSGTHAIACALFGNLRSGERLACLTGRPYD